MLTFLFGCIAAAQDHAPAPSQLLEEANMHYRLGRPAEAVRLFRAFLERSPERADVRVYLGAALLNLNELDAALEEARRAIATDPKLPKAYVLAGRIYAGQRQWQGAQTFFAKALEIDDSDRDGWYFSGRAFYEAGQFDESIQALLRAGSNSRVYENLGLAYEAAGRFSEADSAYGRAVKSSKGFHRPYVAYGVFLFKQGRLNESLTVLKEAVRLEPDSMDARFELGRILYQAGQYKDAILTLPDAPPDQCRVHNLRGRTLIHLGRDEEAQQAFDAFRACTAAASSP